MLEKMLALMRRGGVQTTQSLARQLDVTPGLIEAMLADLQQRGLVAQAGECGDGCTGCAVAEDCNHATGQRLWTVRA